MRVHVAIALLVVASVGLVLAAQLVNGRTGARERESEVASLGQPAAIIRGSPNEISKSLPTPEAHEEHSVASGTFWLETQVIVEFILGSGLFVLVDRMGQEENCKGIYFDFPGSGGTPFGVSDAWDH